MKKSQQGFTLVELIAVIAILGILAAVAVPKFVNMRTAAEQASVAGVAGGLASASALNYAAYMAKVSGADTSIAVVDTTVGCATSAASLLSGGVPDGFTVSGTPAPAAGGTTTCTVTVDGSSPAVTADYTLHGAE